MSASSLSSAARRPAPLDPHDALAAALDDALARMVPRLTGPAEQRTELRAALLALVAALDRHAPLPLAAAERVLAPLLERSASRAGLDPALAALRMLLDRARALAA